MKNISFLTLLFSLVYIKAQEYKHIPLVEDGNLWSYYHEKDSSTYSPYDTAYYEVHYIGMDTLYNKQYKKIYSVQSEGRYKGTHWSGKAIREKDKQVFLIDTELPGIGVKEHLIYDFGMGKGDTIIGPYTFPHVHCVVTETDTVEVNGTLRKRLHLRGDQFNIEDVWIEGIGSVYYNFYSPLMLGSQYDHHYLNFQKSRGMEQYRCKEWYYNPDVCEHPLVDESLRWSYCEITPTQTGQTTLCYFHLYFQGDTLIGNKSYKKLYCETPCSGNRQYLTAMREENKKVYARNDQSSSDHEQLIYDFGLHAADTMLTLQDGAELLNMVEYTDVVRTDDGWRKRIRFGNDTWIEGIGSTDYFLPAPLSQEPLSYKPFIRLNWLKRGEAFVYRTNDPWLREDDCPPSFMQEANPSASTAVLYQNTPNPFSQATSIRYYLPETVATASLCIYDMQGKQLQQITLTQRGEGTEQISASLLAPGMYLYALIADGQEVDVKRMILTE